VKANYLASFIIKGSSPITMLEIKYNILIIEPDRDNKDLLVSLLRSNNYDCEATSSAEKGLRLLKQKHFDLVLSETKLEKKSGLELLREVRKNFPVLPVFLMTESPSVETSIDAINLGVTSFQTKPIDEKLLLEVTKRAIRHHKSRYLKNPDIQYSMENTFNAIVSSSEQAILKLLDTVDNMMELVYTSEYSTLPDLKMAIYEGLSNAMEHGNQENPDKKIFFSIELKMDRIIVQIKDEGQGFDFHSYWGKKEISQNINHGLSLVTYLMDEISFNTKGNEISLLKILRN